SSLARDASRGLRLAWWLAGLLRPRPRHYSAPLCRGPSRDGLGPPQFGGMAVLPRRGERGELVGSEISPSRRTAPTEDCPPMPPRRALSDRFARRGDRKGKRRVSRPNIPTATARPAAVPEAAPELDENAARAAPVAARLQGQPDRPASPS